MFNLCGIFGVTAKTIDIQSIVDEVFYISTTDLKGNITSINNNLLEKMGYTKKEVMGRTHSFLLPDEYEPKIFEDLWTTIARGQTWTGLIENVSKRGEIVFFYTIIRKLNPKEYISIRTDVTCAVNDNIQMYETHKEMFTTISNIVNAHINFSSAKALRISEWSYHLALEMGLGMKVARDLRLTAPMHDIGKIGIPQSILGKPTRLTESEYKLVQQHTVKGARFFKESDSFLHKMVVIIAEQHHEKWDGSGYPKGLKGEEIHIWARVVAIIDVFDSLRMDKDYRKAWSYEKITEHFKAESGKSFDPEVVRIFLENLPLFEEIEKTINNPY